MSIGAYGNLYGSAGSVGYSINTPPVYSPPTQPLPGYPSIGVPSLPTLPNTGSPALSMMMGMMGILQQLLKTVLGLPNTTPQPANLLGGTAGSLGGGFSLPSFSSNAGLQQTFGSAPSSFATVPQQPARAQKVYVIDDFSSNDRGFQHGSEIVDTIESKTGGRANVDARNIFGRGAAGILQEMQQIASEARAGDVINLSQVAFNDSADTQQIRSLINQLSDRGVRVVVAAGNNGPGQTNFLSVGTRAIVAAANSSNSGIGNIVGQGSTTSFAAADITARIVNGQL